MTGNPYASRLTITAWTGIITGIILGVISSAIDPIESNWFGPDGVNEAAAWWKLFTGVLADASVAVGIAAAIGWTILAGVEWRIGQGTAPAANTEVNAGDPAPESPTTGGPASDRAQA